MDGCSFISESRNDHVSSSAHCGAARAFSIGLAAFGSPAPGCHDAQIAVRRMSRARREYRDQPPEEGRVRMASFVLLARRFGPTVAMTSLWGQHHLQLEGVDQAHVEIAAHGGSISVRLARQ